MLKSIDYRKVAFSFCTVLRFYWVLNLSTVDKQALHCMEFILRPKTVVSLFNIRVKYKNQTNTKSQLKQGGVSIGELGLQISLNTFSNCSLDVKNGCHGFQVLEATSKLFMEIKNSKNWQKISSHSANYHFSRTINMIFKASSIGPPLKFTENKLEKKLRKKKRTKLKTKSKSKPNCERRENHLNLRVQNLSNSVNTFVKTKKFEDELCVAYFTFVFRIGGRFYRKGESSQLVCDENVNW